MNILTALRSRFADVLEDFTDDVEPFVQMVRPAQDSKFGDYQANCAMPLAKRGGTSPRDVALRIVDKLNVTDMCRPAELAGPGFINLTLRDDWLELQVNRVADDPRLGLVPAAEPKNVVVDFSGPNVAKPMHVGHLRSSVIGDCLAKVYRCLGHAVVTDNHLGDWGTQFGMIIYGYKHFLDPARYAEDPVGELARLYRLVNRLCDYHDARDEIPRVRERISQLDQGLKSLDPESADKQVKKAWKKQSGELADAKGELKALEAKVASVEGDAAVADAARRHPEIAVASRRETAKLHAGDQENLQLWQRFLPQCLDALQALYDRLGIRFDHVLGESFYNEFLPDVVAQLRMLGLARTSDGAQCVFLEGHAAPFIIQKADGAFTYATTDLATLKYRVETFQAETLLYVVDSRQSEHFEMLFKTARNWGYADADLRHVSFGTVMGKDGKPYKTRSGDTVGLESLLDEAVAKAFDIVSANDDARTDADGRPSPELSLEMRREIAVAVGIGGIKYADLQHNRESDYVFDLDKMLAMNGNTATYLQYAYARIQGIFRKGGINSEQLRSLPPRIQLTAPAERTLALKLARYSETIEDVAADCRPNLLTQYLFELANDLTSFYACCPVLNAETETLRLSRLMLCDVTGRVLEHGMTLLGIQAPRQM